MKKFLLISTVVTVGLIFSISTACAGEVGGVNQGLWDTKVNAPIGSTGSLTETVPVGRFAICNGSSTQQMKLQGGPVSLPWYPDYSCEGGWNWSLTSQLTQLVDTSRIAGTYVYPLGGRANVAVSMGGGRIKPQFQQADTSSSDEYGGSSSEQGSSYAPDWGLGDSSCGFFWGLGFDYLCCPSRGIGFSAGYFNQQNTNVGHYRYRSTYSPTKTWELNHDKAITTQFFAHLFIKSLIGAFRPFFSVGINSTQISYSGTASYRETDTDGTVLSEQEKPFSYTMVSENILEFRGGAYYDFNQSMFGWLELMWRGGHLGAKTGLGLRL